MPLNSTHLPNLTGDRISAVKNLRAAFESQLQTEGGSSIETWLSKVSAADRSALFLELLDAELSFHRQHGREPSAEEYLARFPDFQQEIHWAFEALTLKPPHGSNDLSIGFHDRRGPAHLRAYLRVGELGKGRFCRTLSPGCIPRTRSIR